MKKELNKKLLENKKNKHLVSYTHINICVLFTLVNLIFALLSNSFCAYSECLNSINIIIYFCIYNMSKSDDLKKTTLYQPFGFGRTISLASFINNFITIVLLINNIIFDSISIY